MYSKVSNSTGIDHKFNVYIRTYLGRDFIYFNKNEITRTIVKLNSMSLIWVHLVYIIYSSLSEIVYLIRLLAIEIKT